MKRYKCNYVAMTDDPHGDYVEYADVEEFFTRYDLLKQQNEELLEALEKAHSFIDEITQINGKYSYLNSRMNGTVIISDAYSVLSTTGSAISKVQGEKV